MDALGLLKIRVRRGINLAVRDAARGSSDPYVIIACGAHKVKTSVLKSNLNPEWNEELTISIKDLNVPIVLTVHDKDTFSLDDNLGKAEIDIKPYIECFKTGFRGVSDGITIERIQPSEQNCLSEESCIIWKDEKMTQDMTLKLRKIECGEIELQIEWINLPGCKGLPN
ncbi:protein C2-DOMAIN ABA-RELATED 4-like [Olea europaea var. sylvestris]|uniref:protein C2-DOMAIN ABA-RELATED 4-like n=1 Tax=Olea europaea var. sylvestris TaxID=158386 RepID=UPI000C1D8B04|nr:protein C2-DOMAIN ABA-RELATED 4-like [Olea europaea var. sylvestris]